MERHAAEAELARLFANAIANLEKFIADLEEKKQLGPGLNKDEEEGLAGARDVLAMFDVFKLQLESGVFERYARDILAVLDAFILQEESGVYKLPPELYSYLSRHPAPDRQNDQEKS